MPRAFRHEPPEVRPTTVLRPAVQATLVRRFDRRLTTIKAGPGFGKTTALARAISENRLAPAGVDLWVGCEAGDDADSLTAAVSLALAEHASIAPDASVDSIVGALAGMAPVDVCVVIDDIEHISDDPWAVDLLAAAPLNAHFVWAGRSLPSPPAGVGPVAEISETDLLLRPEEAAQLAADLGDSEIDPAALGGWPALVEVAARHGAPLEYIDDEVFGRLGDDAELLIDCLVACDHADHELLATLAPGADPGMLEELPLIGRRGGEYAAHAIWRDLRSGSPRVALLRNAAVDELVARDEPGRALDLMGAIVRSGHADDDFDRRFTDAAIQRLNPRLPVAGDQLRAWSRIARDRALDGAIADLLRGLVLRLDRPADDQCVDALTAAAEAFARADHHRGEAVARGALVYPLHRRGDTAALTDTFTRVSELAARGVDEARPQALLAAATVATVQGDLAAVEAIVPDLVDRSPPGPTRTAALWMWCNALNGTGRPSIELADRLTVEPAHLPGMCSASFIARWQLGRVGELRSHEWTGLSGDRDRYVAAVWSAYLAIVTGDLPTARSHLADVHELAAVEISPDGSNVAPEVALAIEEHRDADAATLMRRLLEASPLDGPAAGYHLMGAGLIYVLLAEHREHLDALETGPLIRCDIDIARALVAVIEHGDTDPILTTPLPASVGELLTSLGLRHTTEYLAAAHAGGLDRASELVGELTDLIGERARTALATASEHHSTAVASGADDLLATVPIQPDGSIVIRLFGAAALEVDGAPEAGADWRRERVRALLAFVLMHPSPTRETAMVELWPDADADAARRNLRSTLNRLNNVLEPNRRPGDAPFHIRSYGQLLSFRTGSRAQVDVHRFTELVDRGADLESAGTPSLAIDEYLAAIHLYRGDLLPDSYSAWVLVQRDALRARFVNAGVRCTELLSAIGRHDDAIAAIERVLPIEPHSEAAHRSLVSAQLARGDVTSARRSMATCEQVLHEVGGIAEPATQIVKRRLAREEAS